MRKMFNKILNFSIIPPPGNFVNLPWWQGTGLFWVCWKFIFWSCNAAVGDVGVLYGGVDTFCAPIILLQRAQYKYFGFLENARVI